MVAADWIIFRSVEGEQQRVSIMRPGQKPKLLLCDRGPGLQDRQQVLPDSSDPCPARREPAHRHPQRGLALSLTIRLHDAQIRRCGQRPAAAYWGLGVLGKGAIGLMTGLWAGRLSQPGQRVVPAAPGEPAGQSPEPTGPAL